MPKFNPTVQDCENSHWSVSYGNFFLACCLSFIQVYALSLIPSNLEVAHDNITA